MARLIGVVGPSGSGKTTGLRNLDPKQTVIVQPNSKSLPWKGAKNNFSLLKISEKTGNLVRTDELEKLPAIIKHIDEERPDIKYLIFDDFTHFFNSRTQSNDFRSKTAGGAAFKKYADLAADTFSALFKYELGLRSDLTMIHHFHVETGEDVNGAMRQLLKTPGKLLDREIDVPSYYTYLLFTVVLGVKEVDNNNERYKYLTNDDGVRPAKTPMGCFDKLLVPNDMYEVIKKIEEYESN